MIETAVLVPIVVVAIIVVLAIVFVTVSWKKAPTNKAWVKVGLGKPKYYSGEGFFKLPMIQSINELTLEPISVDVNLKTPVQTEDKISVMVTATVNAHIPFEMENERGEIIKNEKMLTRASHNWNGKTPEQIASVISDTLAGNIREIVGTMKLTDMIGNRKRFAELAKETATPDLENMGLEITTFNINNFDDCGAGIIDALGANNSAEILKSAANAKSDADREVRVVAANNSSAANEAEIKAETEIAERNRDLKIRLAQMKQETDVKQAEADAAYKIQEQEQEKTLQQTAVNAQIARTDREAELKRKEVSVTEESLNATVRKKAEADRYAKEQAAAAEKTAQVLAAEAALAKQQRDADAALYVQQQEAEAKKAQAEADFVKAQKQADAVKAQGEAEAAATKATGDAQANVIRLKGEAEAKAIEKKADAMQRYNDAAKMQMVLDALPQILPSIADVVTSNTKIGDVTYIGGTDSDGSSAADSLSDIGPLQLKKTFATLEQLFPGLNITDMMMKESLSADTNRNMNINVTADDDAKELVHGLADIKNGNGDVGGVVGAEIGGSIGAKNNDGVTDGQPPVVVHVEAPKSGITGDLEGLEQAVVDAKKLMNGKDIEDVVSEHDE